MKPFEDVQHFVYETILSRILTKNGFDSFNINVSVIYLPHSKKNVVYPKIKFFIHSSFDLNRKKMESILRKILYVFITHVVDSKKSMLNHYQIVIQLTPVTSSVSQLH